MGRLFILIVVVWLILFAARILQIGGLDPTYRDPENRVLEPLRTRLTGIIQDIMPYPQSTLLSGILLGEERLPFGLKSDLKTTATIHMVVVSGQNLSILGGFIVALAPYLGRKRTVILTLPVIFFYSVLTGFQVPVIRAAIMVSLTYIAQILGKEKTGWLVLLFTAGVMLLVNPNWLMSISFQLSFMATLAVVVLAPILSTKLPFVPKILREDLSTTLSAQALTLPLIAFYFQQISLVGVLANILTLWTIPFIMISGFVVLALGAISNVLGQVVGLFPGTLLTYFIYIVEFFASLPLSSISIGETSVMLWVGYYILVGAGVWGISKKTKNGEVS